MQSSNLPDRYDRQMKLPDVRAEGQSKLSEARVLIIGVGGLGCPAAQYLAAAGIGTLGLMDFDTVSSTNLHRQILFGEEDVGTLKVEAAKRSLTMLNSEIEIATHTQRLGQDNAEEVIASYDLVIDGSDNFQTKYLINDACLLCEIPWVYASIYKFQGQISVFNYRGGPSYRCLFPNTTQQNVSCEEVGVMGVLPGVLGVMQANEAIKICLGIGPVLSGKLKLIDLLSHRDQVLTITRNEAEISAIKVNGIQPVDMFCQTESSDRMYLDVRNAHEQPRLVGENVLEIPINELRNRYSEIPTKRTVHVVCATGNRSRDAISYLEETHGFTNLENVTDGVKSIITNNEHSYG